MKQIQEELLHDSDKKEYNPGETAQLITIAFFGLAGISFETWLIIKNTLKCSSFIGGFLIYSLAAVGLFLCWALISAAILEINTKTKTKTIAPTKEYIIVKDQLFFKKGKEYFKFCPDKVLDKLDPELLKVFSDLPQDSKLDLVYREYYKHYDFYNGTRPKFVLAEERKI